MVMADSLRVRASFVRRPCCLQDPYVAAGCADMWLPENPASAGSDETGETRLAVVAGYSSPEDQKRLPFCLALLLPLSASFACV